MKSFFKGMGKGMKFFGTLITTIVNSVTLIVVYIIGIGLTALIAKLSKKELIQKKLSYNKETYWTDLNISNKKMDDYYRQF